jgi:hypothetical protein
MVVCPAMVPMVGMRMDRCGCPCAMQRRRQAAMQGVHQVCGIWPCIL